MSRLRSRWYRDERDLDLMLKLVTASAMQHGPASGCLHRGDVVWGLFPNLTIDPTERIRLFEDDRGELLGFIWLYPPSDFGIHINRAIPVSAEDVAEMATWAERHLKEGPFHTELESDDVRPGLERAGYQPTGEASFQLNTRLLDDIPSPVLPAGAVVRPVRFDDRADVESRVALHREVWEPSKFSFEGYERLRQMPVYRPELDLVAVTPEGDLAAYCIVWLDEETRTGLFEPVGASVRFRRQGYGKALLFDAMRRLRDVGAVRANVVSETDAESEPARRLYASTGFETVVRFERWTHDPSRAEGA